MSARRSSTPIALVLAAAVVAGFGVSRVQPALADDVRAVKEREDSYAIPPPTELRAMTLGYHAAAADALWAKLLLEYGVHWHEKRYFTDERRFIDAIIELEPEYETLYHYVDTMLVYQPPVGTEQDAKDARAYLELGLKEHPYDHELWLHYGQFIAFTGVSFLTNEHEQDQWRIDGANAIARSMELGESADRTMAAPGMLGRSGARDAAVRYLTRAYAVTDDQNERDKIAAQLEKYQASAQKDELDRVEHLLQKRWGVFPFLSRGQLLLVGPTPRTAAECVGKETRDIPECARSWPVVVEEPASDRP